MTLITLPGLMYVTGECVVCLLCFMMSCNRVQRHLLNSHTEAMSLPQLNGVTEQELLAGVHALKLWRCYLDHVEFTVVTDHSTVHSACQKCIPS